MSGPLLFAVSVAAFVLVLYVAQHLIGAYLTRLPGADRDAQFLSRRDHNR